ncbi:MAG: glutamine synthetase family protein [Gaiellales bacterium]|jgi:glutamine synthetase|nr:glutamine synthetase family protein [Gaiellales bacterium]
MSDTKLADLIQQGVTTVRLSYSDLHGIARGKEFPASYFEHLSDDGAPACEAIMTVDLKHNVVAGFEHGFQDINARVDPSTLRRIPWDPEVAWALADLERMDGTPYGVDSRGVLKKAVAGYTERGLTPILGPELEFYLCEADPSAPNGFRRYVNNDSHVYTVGSVADPRGVLREMLHACADLGLKAYAANHEFGRSQYEINLRHSDALDAADRAFLFKTTVKEIAAQHGLLATFIGKPWNDDEGSGFHLHLSLGDESGANLLNGDLAEGLSPLAHHFLAGLLEHGPALMAFFNPTTNAYRRIHEEALVPTLVSWGHDNRLCLARVPRERGGATRVELRLGDGAANPYLAAAAALFAGLDGIERELEPPEPIEGLIYEQPAAEECTPLPRSFDAALEALDADELIKDAMGADLVGTFLTIKGYELDRAKKYVTDWEFAEYTHHL